MLRMWRVSRLDFLAAAIALSSVLLAWNSSRHPARGYGFHIAAAGSRVASAHRLSLGDFRGPAAYSDMERQARRQRAVARHYRVPPGSLAAVHQRRDNAGNSLESAPVHIRPDISLVVCDLSASPYSDLAGSRMLREFEAEDCRPRHVALWIVGAHGKVRNLLLADGLGEKTNSSDSLSDTR